MDRPRSLLTCRFAACLATASISLAQGTAFTYQGRLDSAGNSADGTHDLRFRLWTSSTDPNSTSSIGPTLCLDQVDVQDGLFTVALDFGSGPFNGTPLWLGIEARADATVGNCNSGFYTPLSPRQPLTPAPFAIYATRAGTAALAIPFKAEADVAINALLDLENTRTTTNTYGAIFRVRSPVNNSRAVTGLANGASGLTYGVWGEAQSAAGVGVWGESAGTGVWGKSTAASGLTYGVRGETSSASGYAGHFTGGRNYFSGNVGIGTDSPVVPLHVLAGQAVARLDSSGAANGSVLVLQNNTISPTLLGAINFQTNFVGTPGQIAYTAGDDLTFRVNGAEKMRIDDDGDVGIGTTAPTSRLQVTGGSGVNGLAVNQSNASGGCAQFTITSAGNSNDAVRGVHFGDGNGVYGQSSTGIAVQGEATATSGVNFGVHGTSASPSGRGVYGVAAAAPVGFTSYGVMGEELPGSFGFGVFAIGEVSSTGGKPFRIDHPDDPENKYLLHYAAESPEIINFYSGTASLDEQGEALVELPSYFGKINRDPRYFLTPIGAAMPNLHIAEEISSTALADGAQAGPDLRAPRCSFRVAGGAPGARVSWEVKAIRNDLYVQNRGAPVEVEKAGLERGTYQHPEFYGRPAEKGFNYEARRVLMKNQPEGLDE